MKITTDDLRQKWFDFWRSKDHVIIPSAGVIPENDPTALFHNSGMHPLVPYLLGEPHPEGTRLANVQKSIRTGDIEEVGDKTHLTFFEMLGNWSLGDFFKKEQIEWSFEFLTKTLNLPLERLACSVFEGDENAPRDEFSAGVWEEVGMPKARIAYLPASENWWAKGETGPCGPDSEMFYWTGDEPAPESFQETWEDPRWVEIWNDVFMQFNKDESGKLTDLPAQNIDTGMGLERTVAVLNGMTSVYETDAFLPILKKIADLSGNAEVYDDPVGETEAHASARVIADHIRSATIILGDGIAPSNLDQGYILRRLIRRAIRHGRKLGITENLCAPVAESVIEKLRTVYPEIKKNENFVYNELKQEEEQFQKAVHAGERMFEKVVEKCTDQIAGDIAFDLYQTYGFPIEMTIELAQEKGLNVDEDGFHKAFEDHQKKSRDGATKKFQGGLSGEDMETEAKLHTATHLLHAALRHFLGDTVEQKGSNITAERLRFDFNYSEKVEKETLDKIEAWVNEAIEADVPIHFEEMTVEEAKKVGAMGLFEDKYGAKVKVYKMGSFSTEICGGPHAERTGILKSFKIKKEQSASRGIRRIKAVIGK